MDCGTAGCGTVRFGLCDSVWCGLWSGLLRLCSVRLGGIRFGLCCGRVR